jgi:UDP-glucose 4-epimerase
VIGAGRGVIAGDMVEFGLHRWESCEILQEALEELHEPVDLIIHCAGSGLVGASFADPEAEFRNSAGAAIEVLEFARKHSPRARIVMLSSAAVYGDVTHLPIKECAPLQPISPYGKSRLAIEHNCLRYGDEHALKIAIIRLFSVYGRGLRKQLFWDACQKFARYDGSFFGTGNERRDWLHINDALRLIEVAATSATAAVPIMNGGSGRSIRIGDALTLLRDAWPAAAPQITFSGIARAGDPPGYEADISTVCGLGWRPATGLESGLADYARWAYGCVG